ncbi:phosphatase domain-containing protein [Bacteroidota bacterium]
MKIHKKEHIILPQTGINYQQTLWLEGQIIGVRKGYFKIKPEEHPFRNFLRIIQYYLPSRAKPRNLIIKLNGQKFIKQTDRTGYFKIKIHLTDEDHVLPLEYQLFKKNKDIEKIRIPEMSQNGIFTYSESKLGVISDIDDTILLTYVNRFLKKARTILTRNAFSRKPVKDMSRLYRILKEKDLSFFYVSNSEYNLYPLIKLFLDYRDFPEGPVYLKPYRKFRYLIRGKQMKPKATHKLERIQFLLSVFPQMKFLLIGDDSEADPFIYSTITKNYPDRIKAILIRKTRYSNKHTDEIRKLFGKYDDKLYLFTDASHVIQNLTDILSE